MMNGSSRRSDVLRETRRDNLLSPPFEPLFFGDWAHALFIHYEVDAAVLQNEVPFELDLWNGKAFVSLVAFSLRRLRPCSGGRLGELLFKPISSTRFLNVRTYVRHRNESGIYFIAEFLSNPLCVPLGPPTFGLPYRFGRLVYRHSPEDRIIGGTAQVAGGSKLFSWQAALVLEDEPENQYSYPAVIQTRDGMVHVVYTWRRLKIKHAVVDPSKLVLRPIVDGQWPPQAGGP